jgi:hypothetical protein
MSDSSQEFARYAKAERYLCEAAVPILNEVVLAIEAQTGLCIAEARITVDWSDRSDGSVVANCTIVRAHATQRSVGDGNPHHARPASSDGLSSVQE